MTISTPLETPLRLAACHACDCLQREVALPPGGVAECARCGEELYRDQPNGLERTFACAVGALVLFAIANAYPLFGLDAQGVENTASLFDTVQALWMRGSPSVAVLVFVTTILAPAAEIFFFVYLLGFLHAGRVAPGTGLAFRTLRQVEQWAMVEVFMLGTVVSLVKLTSIADVTPGTGLYALAGTMALLAAAWAFFQRKAFWERVEQLRA